jgi:prepilin-type N-terminal cleavage/methylation domain-containing protein
LKGRFQYSNLKYLKKMNKKGFTLIELLVVIAIIGMLSSVVLVSLGPARKKSRDARRQSDIRQISLAMEMASDDLTNGGYVAIAGGASPTTARITTTAIGAYLATIPSDPGGGASAVCTDDNLEMAAGAYCGFTSAVNASEYCIYAKLSTGNFFTASEKGVNTVSTLPTLSACHP